MRPCRLDLAGLTADQPFCAGVILIVDGRLVLTLNSDHLPAEQCGTALRVGGVGGGQEPGETVLECALREAQEELMVGVEVVSSPRTFIGRLDEAFREVRCTDAVRPLLVWSHPRPDQRPYAPGLPAGPTLYNAFFLARTRSHPKPGDVDALLLLPPGSWSLVEQGAALREAVDAGARVIQRHPIPPETHLWSFPDEAMGFVVELAAREPDLLAPLR